MRVFFTAVSAVAVVFVSLAAASPSGHNHDSDISISAEVDRGEVYLGERVRYTMSVEWNGPSDRYDIVWPEEPELNNLLVAGSKRATRSWIEGATPHSRQDFTWILESTAAGTARIGEAWVNYRLADGNDQTVRELTTGPVNITVHHPAGGRARILSITYAALAALALGVLGGWYRARYRRQRRSPARPHKAGPSEEPLDRLFTELDSARKENAVAGSLDSAARILRSLTARRLAIPTDRMTGPELLAAVQSAAISDHEKRAITGLINEVEQRRYAPGGTSMEDVDRIALMLRLLSLSSPEKPDED